MSQRFPEDDEARRRRAAAKATSEAKAKLTAHRGLATWGERLVPLEAFRQATADAGQQLSATARAAARSRFVAPHPAAEPIEGPYRSVAVFGGVYSNRFALEALLEDAAQRGVEAVYCLGDLGGFGPEPEKIWPLLEAGGVKTIQGNYEASLASLRDDCNCGYTDPRDNHYATISYRYTAENCSPAFKRFMGGLPERRRIRIGRRELLLVHGAPRRINEFLFESTTPDAYLELLLRQYRCDGILCTHSGLHWHRRLPSGGDVVNVGVIGRPANDGQTNVWYCILGAGDSGDHGSLEVELVPLAYAHHELAASMRDERLPEPFVETILSGWWTTCLEVLPARERGRSRY